MASGLKVVVAGAGPGGCIFARDLAKAGIDVTVYEKGRSETLGHDWSDAVERAALGEVGFDLPPAASTNTGPLVKSKGNAGGIFEEHAYPIMDVWAPDYSTKKKIEFRYITTDRRALGRLLHRQAADAGVKFVFGHEVIDLLVSGGETLGDVVVKGMTVRNLQTGEIKNIEADITVDDTGFNAALRTKLPEKTGIARVFSDDEFAMVFRTVRRRLKEVRDDLTDHYRYGYKTGYQWAQFLNDDEVDTGAGVRHNPENPDPKDIVNEFISRHPSITGVVLRGGGGLCLVGRSPSSLVASGFMTIGDAASQTIPMTGCGAGGAMAGGKYAAETVIKAASEKNTGIATLWDYNWKWFAGSKRGANYAGLTAIRNILQDLTMEDISFLFRKDILDSAMLTNSINGVFMEPDLKTMLKTLAGGISRPRLLLKLNKATSAGKKTYRHYMNYPKTWSADVFEKWIRM